MKRIKTAFTVKILFAILLLPALAIETQAAARGEVEAQGSQISDSERFALEYPLVGKDNIFVYRNASGALDL